MSRQVTYARRDNLRTSDVTSNGSGVILDLNLSYTYFLDKNVKTETTTGSFLDATSFTVSYDGGNRLENWNREGIVGNATRKTEEWNYDDVGNHLQVTRDGDVQASVYNENDELISISGDATEFDENWECHKFEGGSAEAEIIGWAGVQLDGEVAQISGEIGFSGSWDITVDADTSSIDFEAKGNPVWFNGRVKVQFEIGWFSYTKEIIRLSAQIGNAPDWRLSIPVASTVG